jgi:hypothetical protein
MGKKIQAITSGGAPIAPDASGILHGFHFVTQGSEIGCPFVLLGVSWVCRMGQPSRMHIRLLGDCIKWVYSHRLPMSPL